MHTGRSGHLFLGKSGVNPTGLCLKEISSDFSRIGSCSYGLWLPFTPQFGEFRISLLITTFVIPIMLRLFEVYNIYFAFCAI